MNKSQIPQSSTEAMFCKKMGCGWGTASLLIGSHIAFVFRRENTYFIKAMVE